MNASDISIEITISAEELITDNDGVDVDASVARYCELFEQRLGEQYPGADISVSPVRSGQTTATAINLGSPTDETFEAFEKWRSNEAAVKDTVGWIAEQVLAGKYGDWIVESVS